MQVVNAVVATDALKEMPDADACSGDYAPHLLLRRPPGCGAGCKRRTAASLETHYVFPALIEHPCELTNMRRGLFSDNIANQVLGKFVICIARNLHTYIRNQMSAKWAPVGGESERVGFATGPAHVTGIDRAHLHFSVRANSEESEPDSASA